ncbi:hypothetical protein PVK06_008757 [Gossypium arboreum]|uniref:Uncharacterized protein n=1 Tax=Gossypium arboreum TaxID=29729 RepID=A0ABR0QM45_GOSAR|nr:hypothetical protein PVK06_008757 [Gossypium arboreum]
MEGNWVTNSKDISQVAKDYFWRLFRSNGQRVNVNEIEYFRKCRVFSEVCDQGDKRMAY